MKCKRKVLSLLLCLGMLLGLLAGCGSQVPTSSAAESSSNVQASTGEATEPVQEDAPEIESGEPEASAVDSSAEEAAEPEEDSELFTWGQISFHPTEIALPLTEEPVTLSLWTDFLPPLFAAMNGMEDNSVYIELEKRTGVDLDITSVAITDASTQASLLVASGDFPNLWYGFVNYYGGTIDSAVDDEIVYNLADYKDSMPNYFAMIDENEELRKDTYTDSGVMAQTYGVFADPKSTQGLALRKDWLEAQGLDVPVTYDDYYEVLTSFKNNYDAVYWMNSYGEQYFSAGYDVVPGFMVRDGKVEYGFMEDAYLDYLTMMNKWYSEGLIWKDFATSSTNMDEAAAGTGEYGVFDMSLSKYDLIMSNDSTGEMAFQGATPAVKEPGQMLHTGNKPSTLGFKGISLSTSCPDEYLEIALQWLDYWFTPDGSYLANYGVEGEAYNLVDGEIVWTELMTNNPELNFTWAMNKYAMASGPFIMDGDKIYSDYNDAQWELMDVYNSDYTDYAYVMPKISLTTEESDIYTSTYNDINTYVSETFLLFINGDKPLDEFDEFVDNIKNLGIQDCLDCQQAAYDRYLKR